MKLAKTIAAAAAVLMPIAAHAQQVSGTITGVHFGEDNGCFSVTINGQSFAIDPSQGSYPGRNADMALALSGNVGKTGGVSLGSGTVSCAIANDPNAPAVYDLPKFKGVSVFQP